MNSVLLACLAYLLGSFPSGLMVAFFVTGADIRQQGSGNIGASNVSSQAGLPAGIAVAALDAFKGAIPVLLGSSLGLPPPALAAVALAAVLGHDFSVVLRFQGGKGVATTFGVALALTPLPALAAMLTWLAAVLALNYASAASLTALALLPLYVALAREPRAYVILGVGLLLLAAIKHWPNILRLVAGTEPKVRR